MMLKLKLLYRVVRRRGFEGLSPPDGGTAGGDRRDVKQGIKVKKANAAHLRKKEMRRCFSSKMTKQGGFVEFALHFLEKCATLGRAEHGSAETV